MQTQDVRLTLTYPTSNMTDDRTSVLTIEEKNSGMRIAEITLDPTQLLSLLASSSIVASAELINTELYDRIGKKIVVDTEVFGRKEPLGGSQEVTETMKAYGDGQLKRNGGDWEQYRWSRTNSGWKLVKRRWE